MDGALVMHNLVISFNYETIIPCLSGYLQIKKCITFAQLQIKKLFQITISQNNTQLNRNEHSQ